MDYFKQLSLANIDGEMWKPVMGFEGMYMVSNFGRIKSLPRLGKVGQKVFSRIMKQANSKQKYLSVELSTNFKTKIFLCHRLVGMAFIPNPLNKPCINHINGIKTDNRVENLEWVSHKENNEHAKITNLVPLGELHTSSKITNKDALFISKSNMSTAQLAKKYNLSKTTVLSIKNGCTWSHLTGKQYAKRTKLSKEDIALILKSSLSATKLAGKLFIKDYQVKYIRSSKFKKS